MVRMATSFPQTRRGCELSGRWRSGWLPRVRPLRAGDTDPALHLMRGLAQKPAPMILIGSPGQEAGNLQNYAHEFPHFATQQAWNYADNGPVGITAEKGTPDIYKSLLLYSKTTRPQWNPLLQATYPLKGHTNVVYAAAITPDGKRAISGSWDNAFIQWDLTTGKAIQILRGLTDSFEAVSITPDGKRAVSGSNKTCILWDLTKGKALQILRGHTAGITAVSITPDGKRAVSGSHDNTCILWDLTTGKALQILIGHTSCVYSVSITSDGKRALSGSIDKTCIMWDMNKGEQLTRFLSTTSVQSTVFFPGGIVLRCGSEVVILNLKKELLCPGLAIITIRQIWDFELQQYLPLSADCPLCGHRFAPPASVVATIENITKKANLKPNQSPCLELPDEAWEDPGLLGNCPKCGAALKFNPFIAGGDYNSKTNWKFWKS